MTGSTRPWKTFCAPTGKGGFLEWDANDLLTLLRTWQTGDVSTVASSNGEGSNFAGCLAGIKAKGLIMPCKTDLYFPVSLA